MATEQEHKVIHALINGDQDDLIGYLIEAERARHVLRSLGFGISGSVLDSAHEAAESVRELRKRKPY